MGDVVAMMRALWGKSDAGGQCHSLLAHLLDTAAVAELIWDEYLTPAAKAALDLEGPGTGRLLLVTMCAWHDLGKATPAFQIKDDRGRQRVEGAGLSFPRQSQSDLQHGQSGALIARQYLGGDIRGGEFWWEPQISGHHGKFLGKKLGYQGDWQRGPRETAAGWGSTQLLLAETVLHELGIETPPSLPAEPPPHMIQLALSGFVSMADWIASSSLFPGTGLQGLTVGQARSRARAAWQALGLARTGHPSPGGFRQRFGFEPTAFQRLLLHIMEQMPAAGLVVIEAPMGAGKTEASLAAVEVLASSGGYEGLVYAMPTQGTSDAMYDRVLAWAGSAFAELQLALLHGKAMSHEPWREQVTRVAVGQVCDEDEYGLPDPFGASGSGEGHPGRSAPSDWILGKHRGLLSPAAVCTVDQPLMAATQVKYVSMRYAGLLGKVLVIDEVHSYDIFTGQYLQRLLNWCGDGQLPVIVMSATLPPAQRAELVTAYASGLGAKVELTVESVGYPQVTTWTQRDGPHASASDHQGQEFPVMVSWANHDDETSVDEVAQLALDETADGGVALVIMNTVDRAQRVFTAVQQHCPSELLHSRLTTRNRAERTAALVHQLGKRGKRPKRLIVVATQVAEQSFDVDADVLITDLAPLDLLMQRIGRLHRHPRQLEERAGHRTPHVIVTGTRWDGAGPPAIHPHFEYVYSRYLLLRTAGLIGRGPTSWQVPADIPDLVTAAYDPHGLWPQGWAVQGDAAKAEHEQSQSMKQVNADAGLLAKPKRASIERLHGGTGVAAKAGHISVRDGEPTLDIALIRRSEAGELTTLSGRPLGPDGSRVVGNLTLQREVLGDTVKLREREAVAQHATPQSSWVGAPMLSDLPVLVLTNGGAEGPYGQVSYSDELGLVIERGAR